MAKTDWNLNDSVMPEDMNQIGQEINEMAESLDNHINATLVHGATDAATPNRIARRDANGQFEVGAPTAANHVARKADLDAHAAITNGAHGATSAATANRIVQRDANGRAKFAAPAASDDVARKAEVDAAIQTARDASVNKIAVYAGSNGINPNTTTDAYVLTSHANTPSGDSKFWYIRTLFYQDTASGRAQIAQSYQGSDEIYIRHYHQSDGWTPWVKVMTSQGGTFVGEITVESNAPMINIKNNNASDTGVRGIRYRDHAGNSRFATGYSPANDFWAIYNYTTGRSGIILYGATDNVLFRGRLSVNNQTTIETNGDIIIRGTTLAPTRVNGGVLQYWNGSTWVDAGKRRAGGTATATFNAGYAKFSVRGLSFTPSYIIAISDYMKYDAVIIRENIDTNSGTLYNFCPALTQTIQTQYKMSGTGTGNDQFQIVTGGFDMIVAYSYYVNTGTTTMVRWMAFEA